MLTGRSISFQFIGNHKWLIYMSNLTNLTDEKENTERTLWGCTYDPRRSWPVRSLKVSPLECAIGGEWLRLNYLWGLRGKIIDHYAICTQMLHSQKEINCKIDDMSYCINSQTILTFSHPPSTALLPRWIYRECIDRTYRVKSKRRPWTLHW